MVNNNNNNNNFSDSLGRPTWSVHKLRLPRDGGDAGDVTLHVRLRLELWDVQDASTGQNNMRRALNGKSY